MQTKLGQVTFEMTLMEGDFYLGHIGSHEAGWVT